MKIRHLPITDLARITGQTIDLQRHALRQVRGGGGGPNYNPTRSRFADIVDRKPAMFDSVRTPWEVVKPQLLAACRSDAEQKMNLPVAQRLYEYCDAQAVRSIEVEGFPISFSVGPKLLCWSPGVFLYIDRISIPFLDLRRSKGLRPEGRRVIFSLMHQALRVNNPDYRDVEFEIFGFQKEGDRAIIPHRENGVTLLSYEELEQRITLTQRLWFDVLAEQHEDAMTDAPIAGGMFQ